MGIHPGLDMGMSRRGAGSPCPAGISSMASRRCGQQFFRRPRTRFALKLNFSCFLEAEYRKMTSIRSICVYCGSRSGANARFATIARDFGHMLAAQHITLVYGGGSVGLMGILARAAKEHGGRVVGVLPRHLDQIEIKQSGLDELHVVDDMHSRKRRMFDLSDAFVALPGAIGTIDETIEVITWRQLGLHDKPILLVNDSGYWEPFQALLDHIKQEGFASSHLDELYQTVDSIHDIFPALARAPSPAIAARNRLF